MDQKIYIFFRIFCGCCCCCFNCISSTVLGAPHFDCTFRLDACVPVSLFAVWIWCAGAQAHVSTHNVNCSKYKCAIKSVAYSVLLFCFRLFNANWHIISVRFSGDQLTVAQSNIIIMRFPVECRCSLANAMDESNDDLRHFMAAELPNTCNNGCS